MNLIFNKGYSIYKKDEGGLYIVCLHSGPAFEVATARDDNSETVASLVFRKCGGSLIISNISRKRLWGIDFNRDIPPLKEALDMYNHFLSDVIDQDILYDYRTKYAWVAKDSEDYYNRLKIYQNFWNEVSNGKKIVFIHRAFPRIKAYPSIMDIVTFDGRGVDKDLMEGIVAKSNANYKTFFKSVEKSYKSTILLESERVIANIISIYKDFNLKLLKGEFREFILKDLEKMKRYSQPYIFRRLLDNFTPQNFLACVKNALDNAPLPQITIEHVFSGKLALGPKRKLFPNKDKIIIEIEPTYFLNFWYPQKTAEIIENIICML